MNSNTYTSHNEIETACLRFWKSTHLRTEAVCSSSVVFTPVPTPVATAIAYVCYYHRVWHPQFLPGNETCIFSTYISLSPKIFWIIQTCPYNLYEHGTFRSPLRKLNQREWLSLMQVWIVVELSHSWEYVENILCLNKSNARMPISPIGCRNHVGNWLCYSTHRTVNSTTICIPNAEISTHGIATCSVFGGWT